VEDVITPGQRQDFRVKLLKGTEADGADEFIFDRGSWLVGLILLVHLFNQFPGI